MGHTGMASGSYRHGAVGPAGMASGSYRHGAMGRAGMASGSYRHGQWVIQAWPVGHTGMASGSCRHGQWVVQAWPVGHTGMANGSYRHGALGHTGMGQWVVQAWPVGSLKSGGLHTARWHFQFWLSLPHWLCDLCMRYQGVCRNISSPVPASFFQERRLLQYK